MELIEITYQEAKGKQNQTILVGAEDLPDALKMFREWSEDYKIIQASVQAVLIRGTLGAVGLALDGRVPWVHRKELRQK